MPQSTFLPYKIYLKIWNPNWSQAQVNSAVEQGVNMLRSQGISTGVHTITVRGEAMTISFSGSGAFRSAWGMHRLTAAFFGR